MFANSGISHIGKGKKNKNKNTNAIPREVYIMARQMGMDLSELGDEANNIWKMLNNMSKSNPEEYDKFISNATENLNKTLDKDGKIKTDELNNEDFNLKIPNNMNNINNQNNNINIKLPFDTNNNENNNNNINNFNNKKSFIPHAGFVYKCKIDPFSVNKLMNIIKKNNPNDEYGILLPNSKLFINFCSHPALDKPIDIMGNVVDDYDSYNNNDETSDEFMARMANFSANGMKIPLLVSPPRLMDDNKGTKCFAIDVIYNTWVIEQCKKCDRYIKNAKELKNNFHKENIFKNQVIELGKDWIKNEINITFTGPPPQLKEIRSLYKGGIGEKSRDPVPFPITEAENQSKPIDERNNNKNNHNKNNNLDENEENEITIHINKDKENNKNKAQIELIDDIDDDYKKLNNKNKTKNKNKKNKNKNKNKSKNKNKNKNKDEKIIKKGFFNDIKEDEILYPNGSAEEPTEGAYSRFMSKCNVVDLQGMNQDEVNEAMRKHAEGEKKPINKSSSSSSSSSSTSYSKPKKNQTKKPKTSLIDDEFEKLVASFDPDFRPDQVDMLNNNNDDDDGISDSLNQLAQVLSADLN